MNSFIEKYSKCKCFIYQTARKNFPYQKVYIKPPVKCSGNPNLLIRTEDNHDCMDINITHTEPSNSNISDNIPKKHHLSILMTSMK